MRTAALILSFAVVASLAYPQDPPVKIGRIVIGKKKADAGPTKAIKTDADILKSAGLKPDDASNLVSYFKSRTLSDDQMTSISAAIKRMGDEKYREREKASGEVVKFGAAALGPLKNAIATDADAEIVFRAEEARRTIETVSQATVAVSAA